MPPQDDSASDSSEDFGPPPLVSRDRNGDDDDSSDSESSGDESAPALLAGRGRENEDSSDDDDDFSGIPALIHGAANALHGSDDDDDHDDDASGNSMPPLQGRNDKSNNSNMGNDLDNDSSDDDADVPALTGGAGIWSDKDAKNASRYDDESSEDEDEVAPNMTSVASNMGMSFLDSLDDLVSSTSKSKKEEKAKPKKTPKESKKNDKQKRQEEVMRREKDARERRAEEERRLREQVRIRREEENKRKKKEKEAEKKRKQRVRRKIFAFCKLHWERKQEQKRYRSKRLVAHWGQRFLRGKQSRKEWVHKLQNRMVLAERYTKLWEPSLKTINDRFKRTKRPEDQAIHSWAACLEGLDFVVNSEDTNDETAKILSDAADKALHIEEEYDDDGQVQDDTDYDAQMDAVSTSSSGTAPTTATNSAASTSTQGTTAKQRNGDDDDDDDDFTGTHTTIMYTENVKKWLRGPAGGRYRDLFVKRMKQLSRGERSRILAKRLKGTSKTVTVFETYLEQKSGKRILWQIEGSNLLVWFVANHDNVSRLMKLIEDSQNRKNRRLTSGDELVHDKDSLAARRNVIEREAILNPLGNTPMKVYEVSLEDVNDLASDKVWVPKLRLTREERDVVETGGTVLLLGRSGTGKTICTANRMDYDRNQTKNDPNFTQLFVARSQKLCAYVQAIIGNPPGTSFETYDKLKQRLEQELPTNEDIRSSFPTELKMRFDVFKREVYNVGQDIDPLLAWTSIRSFIKGSIEATLKTGLAKAISEEEFLDTTVFSSGRCSLTVDQRKIVYPIYQKYVRFLNEKNMWDDCDRILALLLRLELCKVADPEKYHSIQMSKIYVDEVQDYTQAECLLFFYLCDGQGNLFLAGDPAQNVVQGVEFRFQDIRSVEYHIAKDNNTVMQKPKKVHVNFRSHAGILNTAGSILTCMFKAYPKSAENLGEDHGVFVGPRPGVFEKVEVKVLADLLANKMNGTVVLVHDSTLQYWKEALGYPLIRTIRESKGLEYKSVIILDFFGDLCHQVDEGVQKAWRGLLLRGEVDGLSSKYPEIEAHLKLLYTAITRCIEQLFFVETADTMPGKAFVRWLTTTTTSWHKEKEKSAEALATKNKVLDVQARVMTKDEALQSGIQLAAAAEAEGRSDVEASKTLLDQAIYYFELADESMYKKKAQVHLESIGIRSNLPPLPSSSEEEKEDDTAYEQYRDLESNIARTVGKLFDEGLLLEGRDLCSCLVPYVPKRTQQRLKMEIVGPLE
ncbi:unnamed protein product [Cylindrotheca closterium]|uniref:UvrD-like helicase ATP-binding domain-containing protein n=1 Tax=Cylindrotheca closterium TaxID=2856 RepID=A0AAD2G8B9_9STRA|nr:unnamed protein product [Cylindrotheca closterium]